MSEIILASERHGTPREEEPERKPKKKVDSKVASAALSADLENMADGDRSLSPGQRAQLKRMAAGMAEKWMAHVAAPGALGLPELLEKRRLEYGIVDNAFQQEALFDRIYVWQIPRDHGETFEGTLIIKSDLGKQREEETCPRGIIVSAGMRALDNLRSNGVDLGHIINFIRMSPWRMPIGTINGVEIPPLLVMRDGDLVSSEDLATSRRKGRVTTVAVELDSGAVEHRLTGPDGKAYSPTKPWMADDY